LTIWLKDFPTNTAEFKMVLALNKSLNALYLLEEKFVPEEEDDLKFSTPDPSMQEFH
jgi:hypothetical protein